VQVQGAIFCLEEGPWHQLFLNNLAIISVSPNQFNNLNTIIDMSILGNLVMSYTTRITFWQLDYNMFQVWHVNMMSINPTKTFTIKFLMYLEEGLWHQLFLDYLVNVNIDLNQFNNLNTIIYKFILKDLVMSHVTRIQFWQLDYNKFQVWLISMMSINQFNNLNPIIYKFILTDLVTSHVTRIQFWQLDYNKFQVWLISMMSINSTKTVTINFLMYSVINNTMLCFRSNINFINNDYNNLNTNSLTLLISTGSFNKVILLRLGLDLRRQGDKCKTTQSNLIAIFLQPGRRQVVSRMFWYKGKPVYTRPS
jgi:hypothetical protein